MKELVTTEQATSVLRVLAIVLPVLGLAIGGVVGAVRRRVGPSAVAGLVIGLVGPAAYGLWFMYNGIMGRYGLDSVKGLVINGALFAVIGLVIGIGVGLARRRLSAPTLDAGSDT